MTDSEKFIAMKERFSRSTLFMLIFMLAAACVLGSVSVRADNNRSAKAQQRNQTVPRRLAVRMRAFLPNVSGTLSFEPTPAGGVVRLTTLGLPAPNLLMNEARVYVVWAVASGLPAVRVGELKTDASGNGGLEFPRPAEFERYSVLVTAEASTEATNPTGIMVLASRSGAVTSFYGQRQNLSEARRLRQLRQELGSRTSRRRLAADFYSEVDSALALSPGGGRVLELFGDEVTPEAHGLARVTALEQKAYLRAAVTRMPPPVQVGANTYVMWAVQPSGQIVYMGSLPDVDLNESDIYVRVGGFMTDDYDLFVTAEVRRPAVRPSARRALSTRTESSDLPSQLGAIEGRVLDGSGNPLSGATVTASPANLPAAGASTLIFYAAHTDSEGKFYISDIAPGSYKVSAAKEDEGYPRSSIPLFSAGANAVQTVTVQPQRITVGVTIQLGPKAGRLVGKIVDADTGRPVPEAEIMIMRADNPLNYHITGPNRPGGDFQILVPPVPLRIKVTAPGYQEMYVGSSDAGAQDGLVQVASGETRELVISLRRRR